MVLSLGVLNWCLGHCADDDADDVDDDDHDDDDDDERGTEVRRKLGYQAFAGCMRSYLTPGAHQQIIIIVVIIVVIIVGIIVVIIVVINHRHRHKTLRIPGNLLPGACRPSLCLGAGHSSDTGETIFDTDGLAPPAPEKKTPPADAPH